MKLEKIQKVSRFLDFIIVSFVIVILLSMIGNITKRTPHNSDSNSIQVKFDDFGNLTIKTKADILEYVNIYPGSNMKLTLISDCKTCAFQDIAKVIKYVNDVGILYENINISINDSVVLIVLSKVRIVLE